MQIQKDLKNLKTVDKKNLKIIHIATIAHSVVY